MAKYSQYPVDDQPPFRVKPGYEDLLVNEQRKRLQRCTVRLMRHPELCWLSGVTQCGVDSVYADPENHPVDTAYTDGWNVSVHAGFTAHLHEADVMGLYVHENLHKAYRQIQLWTHILTKHPIPGEFDADGVQRTGYDAKEMELLGQAMDFVINQDIIKMSEMHGDVIQLPQGGCYNKMFNGWNTKEVFEYLKQNGAPQGSSHKSPNGGPDGGGDGHEFGDPDESGGKGSEAEAAHRRQQLEAALRQGKILQKAIGKDKSSGADRLLGELDNPKVPWQQTLYRWLTERMRGTDLPTYSRLHRRTALYEAMGHPIPVPTRVDDSMGHIVLAPDTSGSIGTAELRTMLTEVVELCKVLRPEKVSLVYWGSRVAHVEEYTRENLDSLAGSTKPKDGGGTAVMCLHKWVSAQRTPPTGVVVLTDGYVDDWPDAWPVNVFGVCTTTKALPIPYAAV